ncbi:hypothetical protein AB6F65_18730 [Providencia hangzhouensis]|uniref:hypothetical protein n=1 Tax=Providencia hangzhouensis TaxID=3031799 RepID=UPI0034DD4865
MTNISKLLLIIGCLVAIGSILYTQEIIGAYTFSTYRFYTDTVFVRILLFITSLIISASFYPAFADTIESRAKTDIAQGIACIIIGVVVSLFYMYEFNSIVLYALSIATPISIGIGMNILTKGKRLPNKYITLCILVIMLLAAYPFVTMNLFDTDEYSRRMGNLIYHGGTGIYVIIASIIGSISMIYLTEKHKDKERLFTPEEFISTLTKLSALLDADMITQEELDSKKKELIYEISITDLKMDSLEFLAELAPLKQKGILTDDDITNIKKII